MCQVFEIRNFALKFLNNLMIPAKVFYAIIFKIIKYLNKSDRLVELNSQQLAITFSE